MEKSTTVGLNKTSAWSLVKSETADEFAEEYMEMLGQAKTEREFVSAASALA